MKEDMNVPIFDWSDADTITVSPKGSYPRLLRLRDGKMLCAFDGMYVCISEDVGITWSQPIKASQHRFDHLATANAALIELENGDILLGYRAIGETKDGFYTSLQVSVSHDGGRNWEFHSTIDDHLGAGGVWEPHFGYISGILTVFYADDSADRMGNSGLQHIISKQYTDGRWQNRTIISDGNDHHSRDGMPTWTMLSDGRFVLVIEAWDKENNDRMMIKMLESEDGVHFSEPYDVYRSCGDGSKAAAPFVTELPDSSLLISFQTDEDSTLKGDGYSAMKTLIAQKHGDGFVFGAPTSPFEVPHGRHAIWNGLYLTHDAEKHIVFAVSGTNFGGIKLKRKMI